MRNYLRYVHRFFAATGAAPDVPAYPYPWDDEFYGPALIMAGGFGTHGGGGGGHR
jgi:hypothetical protein